MNADHSLKPRSMLALAARAALRFTARRHAMRRSSIWRPVALFWRRRPNRPESAQTGRQLQVAGPVWQSHVHLHVMAAVSQYRLGVGMPGRLTSQISIQRHHTINFLQTIAQAGHVMAQPPENPRSVRDASLRLVARGTGSNVQATTPRMHSARRFDHLLASRSRGRAHDPFHHVSPVQARGELTTSLQAMPAYPNSPRRATIASIGRRAAVRGVPAMPTTSGVRPGRSAWTQVHRLSRNVEHEAPVDRPGLNQSNHMFVPQSRAEAAALPPLHPQELSWRRIAPPAAGSASQEWQYSGREAIQQSSGRSFPGQATAELPHSGATAPTAPALLVDAALIERLADDVIRRVERRERIERARRGL